MDTLQQMPRSVPLTPKPTQALTPRQYIIIQLLVIGFILLGLAIFWLLVQLRLPITFQSVVTLSIVLALGFQPFALKLIYRILKSNRNL